MDILAEAFSAAPASYALVVLVALSEIARRFGKRALAMGPMALLGVAMYVISTAIITSYHHVAGDVQVTVWTVSLLAVGLLYLAILTFRITNGEVLALFAAWAMVAFTVAIAVEGDLLRRAFWVFQYAAIGTSAFVCFLTVKKDDIIALAVWGVLFIAEWVGVAQLVDCQFLHGIANSPIQEGSACAQVYGWEFAPHLPTILTTLMLGWVLFRWLGPRRQ